MDVGNAVARMLLVALMPAAGEGAAGEGVAPLAVRIVPTAVYHDGTRIIKRYGPNPHFHVVITNASAAPVRLWTENYGRGYDALSSVVAEGGKPVKVTKRPIGWDGNYPKWTVLPPGGHLIYEVSFDDAIWQDLPALPEDSPGRDLPRAFTLKAIYRVDPERNSAEYDVWTGTVASPEDEYRITREKPQSVRPRGAKGE